MASNEQRFAVVVRAHACNLVQCCSPRTAKLVNRICAMLNECHQRHSATASCHAVYPPAASVDSKSSGRRVNMHPCLHQQSQDLAQLFVRVTAEHDDCIQQRQSAVFRDVYQGESRPTSIKCATKPLLSLMPMTAYSALRTFNATLQTLSTHAVLAAHALLCQMLPYDVIHAFSNERAFTDQALAPAVFRNNTPVVVRKPAALTTAQQGQQQQQCSVSIRQYRYQILNIAVTYQPALAMATRSPERSLWCAAESGWPCQFSGRIYDSSSMHRVVLDKMSTKLKHSLILTSMSRSTAVLWLKCRVYRSTVHVMLCTDRCKTTVGSNTVLDHSQEKLSAAYFNVHISMNRAVCKPRIIAHARICTSASCVER
eukprot:1340-Heterococcus_DN1.PRE.10